MDINETRSRYNSALEYYKSKGKNSELDVIWSGNLGDMVRIIKEAKSAEELIDKIDVTFMFSINFPPENARNSGMWQIPHDNPHRREKHIDWLLREQKSRGLNVLADTVEESKFIHSRNQVYREGKRLSGNFLRTYSIAYQIFKYLGEPHKILELGAGAGHLCRTITSLVPNCQYFIIDLPETLCFSYTFIRMNFPEKKCLYVTSDEDMLAADNYDYVFIPCLFAENLHGRKFDIFINTASMGEMRNDVIRGWMDLIQNKTEIGSCFTLNRFLNTIHEGMKGFRLNENECSVHYDDRWEILQWELEPSYCRSPYIDTLHSRYVEIIARRPWAAAREDKLVISKNMFDEVADEDWLVLDWMYTGGVMTARDNILVNDMTMNGALFKLWNSIRLNPNRENVTLMTKYLSRLTYNASERTFEEYWYYQNLLNVM